MARSAEKLSAAAAGEARLISERLARPGLNHFVSTHPPEKPRTGAGFLDTPLPIHYSPHWDSRGGVRAAAGPENVVMTDGAGLPAGQRMRPPTVRLAALAAVLIASCLELRADTQAPSPPAPDQSLDRSMESIARAFRTEKPEPITSLMSPDGKVFISLMSLGGGAGYYSRDQVYFIFNRMFTQHDTVKFDLHRQKSENPGRDFVFCIGNWRYHRHDGVDGDIQIHFVLSMRKGAWSLVEIREAQ